MSFSCSTGDSAHALQCSMQSFVRMWSWARKYGGWGRFELKIIFKNSNLLLKHRAIFKHAIYCLQWTVIWYVVPKEHKTPLLIHAMVLQSFFSDRSLHHLKATVPLLVELNCGGVVLKTDPAVWTLAIIEPFHRNQPTAQQLERTNHLLSYLVSIFHTKLDAICIWTEGFAPPSASLRKSYFH